MGIQCRQNHWLEWVLFAFDVWCLSKQGVRRYLHKVQIWNVLCVRICSLDLVTTVVFCVVVDWVTDAVAALCIFRFVLKKKKKENSLNIQYHFGLQIFKGIVLSFYSITFHNVFFLLCCAFRSNDFEKAICLVQNKTLIRPNGCFGEFNHTEYMIHYVYRTTN